VIARILPARLHRMGLRWAHGLRRRWWRWRKPLLIGVCVLACDEQGRVLLVRHSYGRGHWCLPSGALGRREDPAHAALRELREETACGLEGVRALGCFTHDLHGAQNRVHVFAGRMVGAACPDGREVVEVQMFARDALPAELDRQVPRLLALLDRPTGVSEQR